MAATVDATMATMDMDMVVMVGTADAMIAAKSTFHITEDLVEELEEEF